MGCPTRSMTGRPGPPGVHLHWAMPDALLRGTIRQRADGSENRLTLPLLPDRWVVLRILLPRGGVNAVTTGWVLEADRAVAVPLGSWIEGGATSRTATPAGVMVDRSKLTGTVGGAVSWSGVYDAVLNRFAFHDPLYDIAQVAPNGADRNCAAYLVAGWWSNPASDPLDAARSNDSLHELLDRLRWRLLAEWGDEQGAFQQEKAQFNLRKALGLTTQDRWSSFRPSAVKAQKAQGRAAGSHVPLETAFLEQQIVSAASAFATDAARRYVANSWQLRSSLLHGSIYGVPVAGIPVRDRRPSSSSLSVAIGSDDDDLIAAFASASQNSRPAEGRTTPALGPHRAEGQPPGFCRWPGGTRRVRACGRLLVAPKRLGWHRPLSPARADRRCGRPRYWQELRGFRKETAGGRVRLFCPAACPPNGAGPRILGAGR